jgi:hypothetical protein
MIGGHGNGRWMAMEGVFVMVGKCGGDQNLGFNSFVYSHCSYVRKLGSMLTSCYQVANKLLTTFPSAVTGLVVSSLQKYF